MPWAPQRQSVGHSQPCDPPLVIVTHVAWRYHYVEVALLSVTVVLFLRAHGAHAPENADRKSFLFANTPHGAKASAIMLSPIETAKETDSIHSSTDLRFRKCAEEQGTVIGAG